MWSHLKDQPFIQPLVLAKIIHVISSEGSTTHSTTRSCENNSCDLIWRINHSFNHSFLWNNSCDLIWRTNNSFNHSFNNIWLCDKCKIYKTKETATISPLWGNESLMGVSDEWHSQLHWRVNGNIEEEWIFWWSIDQALFLKFWNFMICLNLV